jgi:glycosyltransferase involved in cell wall biosynthesis
MAKLSGGSEWALLLAPEPPYPMAGGGAVRTASISCFLASRFRLHLVTFWAGPDSPGVFPREAAEKLDWIHLPAHRKDLATRVLRNMGRLFRGVPPLTDRFCGAASRGQVARAIAGRRYELAVIEHFWCAPYEELLRRHAQHVIMDMHNIESALHARCASAGPPPGRWAHQAFARLAERAERRSLAKFDLALAASETDRARIRDLAPRARVAVYPNAIPFRFPEPVEEENCIAFSGNLEYHPNVAAVRYFAQSVWPALRNRRPDLRWRLIGKNEWAIRRWISGDPRIETTGAIEDPLTELARARVVVVPLLAASGTRVKILEAWAAGRAVVSTRVGAEGLPAADGQNLLLADTPAEILERIEALLADAGLRRRLGQAARRLVEEQLCWPVAWRGLDLALGDLTSFPSTVASHPIVNSVRIGESS